MSGVKTEKHETNVNVEHKRKAKNISIEKPELEERYQDIIVTITKAAAKKENEVHDTRNSAKDQMERKNAAAAAEAESIFVETVAQETEGRSKKRSSKVDNQRGTAAASEAESTLVDTAAHETEGSNTKRSSKAGNLRSGFAHLEHGRPDGWTSTLRGSGDEKKCSERDKTAGERLQNQRPHSLVRTGGEEDAHEIITNTGCSSGCDLRAGERLPKKRPLGDEHLERDPEEHLDAQTTHQVEEAGSERVRERQQRNTGDHVCSSKKE